MEVKRLSIRGLLPDTDYYMTYDGSTTMPACYETVTWLILNKPIYITKQQVCKFLIYHLTVLFCKLNDKYFPLSNCTPLLLLTPPFIHEIIVCLNYFHPHGGRPATLRISNLTH